MHVVHKCISQLLGCSVVGVSAPPSQTSSQIYEGNVPTRHVTSGIMANLPQAELRVELSL